MFDSRRLKLRADKDDRFSRTTRSPPMVAVYPDVVFRKSVRFAFRTSHFSVFGTFNSSSSPAVIAKFPVSLGHLGYILPLPYNVQRFVCPLQLLRKKARFLLDDSFVDGRRNGTNAEPHLFRRLGGRFSANKNQNNATTG